MSNLLVLYYVLLCQKCVHAKLDNSHCPYRLTVNVNLKYFVKHLIVCPNNIIIIMPIAMVF